MVDLTVMSNTFNPKDSMTIIAFLVDQLGGAVVINADELHRYREYGDIFIERLANPNQLKITSELRGQA